MNEIMQNLDFKINKFELLNKQVKKINKATQRDKAKLQSYEGNGLSIVNTLTGDPRAIVHSQREVVRNKSRTDAQRIVTHENMSQQLKKERLQSGTKTYLPFQDQDKLRSGYKHELLKRNNQFI